MQIVASLFLAVNIFFVKALMQWRQIREATKWYNVDFRKQIKQWSDEALKRWQRYWSDEAVNASSYRFIASVAQFSGILFETLNSKLAGWRFACAKRIPLGAINRIDSTYCIAMF
jgi:hypothetical protein